MWEWLQDASTGVVDTAVRDPLATLVVLVVGLLAGYLIGYSARPRIQ